MRTLTELADYQLLARRFAAVSPQDQPRWGKMNAYQMLRHVAKALSIAPVTPSLGSLQGGSGCVGDGSTTTTTCANLEGEPPDASDN